jgi:hypothetical protein
MLGSAHGNKTAVVVMDEEEKAIAARLMASPASAMRRPSDGSGARAERGRGAAGTAARRDLKAGPTDDVRPVADIGLAAS